MVENFNSLNLKLDGKLVESDIPAWLLIHKKTKIVSTTVTMAATSGAEHSVPMGMSGNWLITGFSPFVNGEAYAYWNSSHCEGNNIKITVANTAAGARTLVVGAVIDYIQW